MANKSTFIIALYGGGQFQGYAKSVSVYHQKVKSTSNKNDAKRYSTFDRAAGDADLVALLTNGGLVCSIEEI